MFKITFISSTLASLVCWLALMAVGINGPSETDPAYMIGFVIGGAIGAALVGLVAGGIAVLLFRSPRPPSPEGLRSWE